MNFICKVTVPDPKSYPYIVSISDISPARYNKIEEWVSRKTDKYQSSYNGWSDTTVDAWWRFVYKDDAVLFTLTWL